ncbi:hypothetical protein [Nonomuraea sp. SBT364]|uniref:hypothetical protein n=1 Tax=Nonomuraea sp. SBT364 TaxID=1580530 RepID=UPI00066C7407|nr:hypothetical protein [Nonomuraea sp. SBT364]
MDNVRDLLTNLLAAGLFSLLGFLAGISRSLVRSYRRRRAHRFWRRFRPGGLHVVLAQFRGRSQLRWEPSGVFGTGDLEALQELQSIMSTLGQPSFDVIYEGDIGRNDKRHNLVVIGGPDGNSVAREMLAGVARLRRVGLAFHKRPFSRTGLRDLREGRTYTPKRRSRAIVDYGMLICAENPFDTRRRVLVVAGVYGYATLAGVMLVNNPAFLDHPLVRSGAPFECSYAAEVVGGVVIEPIREQWWIRALPSVHPSLDGR